MNLASTNSSLTTDSTATGENHTETGKSQLVPVTLHLQAQQVVVLLVATGASFLISVAAAATRPLN